MIRKYFHRLPLQVKISSVYILSSLLIIIVNVGLFLGIDSMSKELNEVYRKNMYLDELDTSLQAVQDNMTDYLNSKTSEVLENYYRSVQDYSKQMEELSEDITGVSYGRMERSIKKMSEEYLSLCSQTIEAKRGRNVEKYRVRYESASEIYGYLRTYISALNKEQFTYNSMNYSQIFENFHTLELMCMIIMGLILVGNISLMIRLTGKIIEPLKALSRSADEIANGNLEAEITDVDSEDEIGVVTRAFKEMVESLREHIAQIKQRMEVERELQERELKMEANLKDAKLKYLQAQINPHFLFNTLNAGAQLAMMEEADKTYEYVQNVADFFRYNIKKADEIVRLADELELIDHYIYILNVRFSGEIHYDKDVDASLLGVKMPGMVLQPIVENSVNHGIREMEGKGQITVKVSRVEDRVCVEIADNGKGMTREQIDGILSGRDQGTVGQIQSNGIAMGNVLSRLRMFTGSDDMITIESDGPGLGTRVYIYLPITERKDEEAHV